MTRRSALAALGYSPSVLRARSNALLCGATASVYPGVELRRELIVKDDRIADRFICESNSEHVYDWAFHSAGTLTVSIATVTRQTPLGQDNGYQHIKQPREGATDSDWTAKWVQGTKILTLKGEPGTIVITGAGPGHNPADSTSLLIVRRKMAKTIFEVEHVFQ